MRKRVATTASREKSATVPNHKPGTKEAQNRPPTSIQVAPKPPILFIKLSRAKVEGCRRRNRRSLAFSYDADITGLEAVIYATGDHGGFCEAYRGQIKSVSTGCLRQFALAYAIPISQSLWNSRYARHVPQPSD